MSCTSRIIAEAAVASRGAQRKPADGCPRACIGRMGLSLPREVGERLVRVGHAVGVLAGAHGLAFLLEGGEELVGEAVAHGAAAAVAAGLEDPADREALLALA